MYLYDFADKPGDWLELEFGDVVVESLEEQIVVRFGEDHPREQVRDYTLKSTPASATLTSCQIGQEHFQKKFKNVQFKVSLNTL